MSKLKRCPHPGCRVLTLNDQFCDAHAPARLDDEDDFIAPPAPAPETENPVARQRRFSQYRQLRDRLEQLKTED